jgi:hypothetical protein
VFAVCGHDELGQRFFAIRNGERGDANPVELKQIKGPEAERRIIFAVIHQRSEARQAGVVTGNELAINDGGFCRDEIDHGLEGAKALGEIGAVLAKDDAAPSAFGNTRGFVTRP